MKAAVVLLAMCNVAWIAHGIPTSVPEVDCSGLQMELDISLADMQAMSADNTRLQTEVFNLNEDVHTKQMQIDALMNDVTDTQMECNSRLQEADTRCMDSMHEKDMELSTLRADFDRANSELDHLRAMFDDQTAQLDFANTEVNRLINEKMNQETQLFQLQQERDNLQFEYELYKSEAEQCSHNLADTQHQLDDEMAKSWQLESDLMNANEQMHQFQAESEMCREDHQMCMDDKLRVEDEHAATLTERDQLQADIAMLEADKMHAENMLMDAEADRDSLQMEVDMAHENMATLTQQNTDLQLQADQAVADLDMCNQGKSGGHGGHN